MENEETKILNPKQNAEPKAEEKTEKTSPVKEKKEMGFASRVAATAAGAALGTSAAMAAEHIYEASVEQPEDTPEEEVKPEDVVEEVQEEATEEPVSTATEQVATASQPQHTVVEHVVTVKVETPQTAAAGSVPENGTYIDTSAPEPTPTSAGGDDEVRVVGVAVQDNGHGGVATLAGLQSGDDSVILVDVETDGRLDYAIHDDNGNGRIDAGEIHDISDRGMSTAEVVGAYVEDAHQHGTMATVTDLDTGNQLQITETEDGYGLTSMDGPEPDDNMYTAANDDMPDYMNDADAGFMDA